MSRSGSPISRFSSSSSLWLNQVQNPHSEGEAVLGGGAAGAQLEAMAVVPNSWVGQFGS